MALRLSLRGVKRQSNSDSTAKLDCFATLRNDEQRAQPGLRYRNPERRANGSPFPDCVSLNPGYDYPRSHQQCFSGNSTLPLGRYCTTYQLAQRRWSSGRGLISIRGRCPAGAGCAAIGGVVPANASATRPAVTIHCFRDIADSYSA
jgi:hypothetical protein